MGVLDPVQVFDQQVAAPGFGAQQAPDFCKCTGFDGAATGAVAGLAAFFLKGYCSYQFFIASLRTGRTLRHRAGALLPVQQPRVVTGNAWSDAQPVPVSPEQNFRVLLWR